MKYKKNVEKTLNSWNKEYKKGFCSYIVLLLLKDCPMYGMEIHDSLLSFTNGKITFEKSGIYHVLQKLKLNGFVTSKTKKSEKGPDRKYYYITESGNQLLKLFTNDYVYPTIPIIQGINKIITKHFPNQTVI